MPLDPQGPLTAVILTRNEEIHLRRCILSIRDLCAKIVVIDSHSQDATRAIAEELGAEVHERPWPGQHADQFNFGIRTAQAKTPWMLRIDADEYLPQALRTELAEALRKAPEDVTGMIVPRLVMFRGDPVRHGGFFPQWLLRVWRTGVGRCEERIMDEHMVLSHGRAIRLKNHLIDDNKNDIFWWTEKHNRYARREAVDLMNIKYGFFVSDGVKGLSLGQAGRKRVLKELVYARLPLGLRAQLYFAYRFFVCLGFLDHPRVWVFHFLQAAWYRSLVDVNVREFEEAVGGATRESQQRFVVERWGIHLSRSPAVEQV